VQAARALYACSYRPPTRASWATRHIRYFGVCSSCQLWQVRGQNFHMFGGKNTPFESGSLSHESCGIARGASVDAVVASGPVAFGLPRAVLDGHQLLMRRRRACSDMDRRLWRSLARPGFAMPLPCPPVAWRQKAGGRRGRVDPRERRQAGAHSAPASSAATLLISPPTAARSGSGRRSCEAPLLHCGDDLSAQ